MKAEMPLVATVILYLLAALLVSVFARAGLRAAS